MGGPPPLTQEQIAELPKKTLREAVALRSKTDSRNDSLNPTLSSTTEEETEECTICREAMQQDCEVLLLKCMHFFHPDCITPWLCTTATCPVCRASQQPAELAEKQDDEQKTQGKENK